MHSAVTASRASSRRCRLTILIVVLALFVVPPLVRASASLDERAPSPIRLNRGFDTPVSKVQTAAEQPPTAQFLPIRALLADDRIEWHVAPDLLPVETILPRSPSVLRGPPTF